MDFRELKRIVRGGEGLLVEFKKKTYYPHKIMKEVVAFANTKGGKLIIGVADDKVIAGLKHPEDDIYVLQKAIANYCTPKVEYQLYRIIIPNQHDEEILVFDIQESEHKPILLIEDFETKRGKAYIRSADKSIQASAIMCSILKGQASTRPVVLQFGEKEKILLQYLETKKKIDLPTYMKVASIHKRMAMAILIKFTLAGVIEIVPQEGGEDYFVHKPVEA